MSRKADPAGLVFPGFTFGKDDPREAERLARLGVGGFCLYHGTPRSVAGLVARLRRAATRPLLICADYEEGAWAHVAGATPLPTNLGVGASGSARVAHEKGVLTAREARAMGVDWVLAPVLDLATQPKNPIVNLRAFSSDAGETTRLGRAFLAGLRAGGALGCVKHFPGHGSTTSDSHLDLPVIALSRAKLDKHELAPFHALANSSDSVMLGHLVVPALDPSKIPLSLSPAAPTLLRHWGFAGLIVTDALDMGAIAKHHGEREAALSAMRAGVDILLVPRNARALVAELRVAASREPDVARRAAQSIRRLDRALRLVRGPRPALSVVGGAAHARRAAALFKPCVMWLRPGKAKMRIAYFEPQAGSRGKLRGAPFVAALRRRATAVRISRSGRTRSGESLVAGLFVRPRAYSGRIALDKSARRKLESALRRAESAISVSFGSPFILSGLSGAALCVFSNAPSAQDAAAQALN